MARNGTAATRVLVVDDSEVVRAKLTGLIGQTPGFQLAGEASDGEAGVKLAAELQPDVVVMDLRMPGISGIEATWKLGAEAPDCNVLMLTVSSETEDIADAVMAGALGYVIKGAGDDEILDALVRVAAGERAISPEVAGRLIERERGEAAGTASRAGSRRAEPIAALSGVKRPEEAPKAPPPVEPEPAADPKPAAKAPASSSSRRRSDAPPEPSPEPAPEPSPKAPPAPSPEPSSSASSDAPPEPAGADGLGPGWVVAIGAVGGLVIAAIAQGEQILDGTADSGTWLKVVLTIAIAVGVAALASLIRDES